MAKKEKKNPYEGKITFNFDGGTECRDKRVLADWAWEGFIRGYVQMCHEGHGPIDLSNWEYAGRLK